MNDKLHRLMTLVGLIQRREPGRVVVNATPPADPAPWLSLAPGETLAPPRKWHPLPGNRIELGNTGFAIQLHVGPAIYLYELLGPEGQCLSRGGDLPSLKQIGERLAEERREFEPFKGA